MAYKPGIQYQKSKVTQTTSSGGGGGGGGSGKEKTVPVNPDTYEFDPFSTFRVPESEVKTKSQTVVVDISSYGRGTGMRTSEKTKTPVDSRVSPIAKALIRGEVSPSDVEAGRVKSLAGISLSGPLAGKIAATGEKPMSIREDVTYQYKEGVLIRDKNIQPTIKKRSENVFIDEKKEGIVKRFGSGVKETVVEPLVSFAKGGGKIIQFEAQNPPKGGIGSWNPSGKPIKSNLSERNLKFKKLIASDEDVKTAVVGGVLIGGSVASPVVATGVAGYQLLKGTKEIGLGIVKKDAKEVGKGVGDVFTSGLIKARDIKRPFIEFTKEKVRAEDVFGGEISGRKVTSKSTVEALSQFEAGRLSSGRVQVITASPSGLKGGKLISVGAGPKGEAGIEDVGIFVGPKGRANIGFTGLSSKKVSGGEVSFNPLESFKTDFPTVNLITVRDVVVPSKKVLREPGFAATSREFVGEGVAVITKRSMIGKGEVEPQLFSPTKDLVTESGLVRLKGKLYREAGTSETEAIIPKGGVLEKKGFGYYTVVNQKKFFGKDVPLTGDLVLLPEYDLIKTSKSKRGSVGSVDDLKVGEVVSKQQSSIASYGKSRGKVSAFGAGGVSYEFKNDVNESLSKKDGLVSSTSIPGLVSKRVSASPIKSNFVSGFSDVFRKPVVDSSFGFSLRKSGGFSQLVSEGKSQVNLVGGVSGFQGASFKDGFKTPLFENTLKLRRNDQRFTVEVRSLGKFKKVGEGVNLKDAIKIGKSVTGGSAARSFKIKTQAGKSLQGLDIGKDYYKKGDIYIEKVGVAINTGGELKQITSQGIASQRRKLRSVF